MWVKRVCDTENFQCGFRYKYIESSKTKCPVENNVHEGPENTLMYLQGQPNSAKWTRCRSVSEAWIDYEQESYVANTRRPNALVCWKACALCKGNKLVSSGLELLNCVWKDLVSGCRGRKEMNVSTEKKQSPTTF